MKMLFWALYGRGKHGKFPRKLTLHKWQLGDRKFLKENRIERVILDLKEQYYYDVYKHEVKII